MVKAGVDDIVIVGTGVIAYVDEGLGLVVFKVVVLCVIKVPSAPTGSMKRKRITV